MTAAVLFSVLLHQPLHHVLHCQRNNKPSDPYKWIGGQTANHAALELVVGLEPTTCSLRMSCSTNWAILANINFLSVYPIRRRVALTATHHLLIYGQKYSRLARLSLSQFSLFLPFASSLHLPLAAVACSANELLYQLSHTSTSDLSIIHQNHTFVNINSSIFLKFCVVLQ